MSKKLLMRVDDDVDFVAIQQEVLRKRADDQVEKPIRPETLLAKVRHLLGETTQIAIH